MSDPLAALARLDVRGWRGVVDFVGRPLLVLSAAAAIFVVLAWSAGRRWHARGIVAAWIACTALFTAVGTWWARQPPEVDRALVRLPLTWGEVRPFLAVGAITFGITAAVVYLRLLHASAHQALPGPRDIGAAVAGFVLALAVLAAGVVLVEMTTTIWR